MCKHQGPCDNVTTTTVDQQTSRVALGTRVEHGEIVAFPIFIHPGTDTEAELAARQLSQLNVATNAPLFER